MNYDIAAKIIVVLSIGGLVTDLLMIGIKCLIFAVKAAIQKQATVDFKFNLWFAAVFSVLIATYFIFL